MIVEVVKLVFGRRQGFVFSIILFHESIINPLGTDVKHILQKKMPKKCHFLQKSKKMTKTSKAMIFTSEDFGFII